MAGSNALTSLISVVGKAAPLLGTLLGSPIAGIVLSIIASHFGVSKDAGAILSALSSTPDADIQLKQLEDAHCEELAKLASTDYQTEVDDRKNAREREIETKDKVPTYLALGFLVVYAFMQAYCVSHSNATNDIISARFQDIMIMIVSYYFGSSHKEQPLA